MIATAFGWLFLLRAPHHTTPHHTTPHHTTRAFRRWGVHWFPCLRVCPSENGDAEGIAFGDQGVAWGVVLGWDGLTQGSACLGPPATKATQPIIMPARPTWDLCGQCVVRSVVTTLTGHQIPLFILTYLRLCLGSCSYSLLLRSSLRVYMHTTTRRYPPPPPPVT